MKEKRILIAAHRGRFGADIVENTLPAFEAAIRSGADIVEADLHKTKDGRMILFHDLTTDRKLGMPGKVCDYTLEELRSRPLINAIGFASRSHVNTVEELLTAMKGRCMINLDQCWNFMDEVYNIVEKMGMENEALIKGRVPYDQVVEWIKSRNWVPQFIPIITCDEEMAQFDALPKELRIPIVEVFLRNETDELISPAFVKKIHDRGMKLWVNSLTLGAGADMAAGHDDDISILQSPDEGWGWLIDHGVDVIQTDWTGELRQYLNSRGL